MEIGFFMVGIIALVLIGYAVYDVFFKKGNPDELTNLEKRYIDPTLADAQKVEADAKNTVAEAKSKVEGIVVKVEDKV